MTDAIDAKALLLGLHRQDLLRAAWIEDSQDGRWNRFLLREIRKGWIRIVNPTVAPDDDSGADLALRVVPIFVEDGGRRCQLPQLRAALLAYQRKSSRPPALAQSPHAA